MNEVKNAVIKGTRLGVPCSDHGILSFTIALDYGGSGQGFGMYSLDEWDAILKRRVATNLGSSLLLAINDVFQVDWEDVPGLSCRALAGHCKVIAIGHYLKDKWLWFDPSVCQFVVTTLADIKES